MSRDDLLLHSLGLLADNELEGLRHELATGSADPGELAEWQALVADLDDDLPAPPPPSLFDRIRQTADAQREPEALVSKVAGLLGDTARRARYLLRMLHDAEPWIELFPGCKLMHVQPGPAIAGPRMDVGFVTLDANVPFPEHEHVGEETVLIISGELVDLTSGARASAGALVTMAAGTEHTVAAGPDGAVTYLVVVDGGVKIGGMESMEPPPEFVW